MSGIQHRLLVKLIHKCRLTATTDDSLNEAYDETREGESIAYSTLDQIDEYISLNRHSDLPSTSLFILSSGLDEYLSHDTIIASEVALKVEEGIKRLSEIGAKSFLVVAPPRTRSSLFCLFRAEPEMRRTAPAEPADPVDAQDLSDSAADYFAFSLRRTLRLITSRMSTPHSLVSLKSSSSQKAYQIPQKHNSLSKLTAVFVDLYTLYSNILANPSAYGFSDGKSVAVPCGLEERCDTNQRLYQTEASFHSRTRQRADVSIEPPYECRA